MLISAGQDIQYVIDISLGLGFIGVRLAQASPDRVQIDEIQRPKHKITKRTHLS